MSEITAEGPVLKGPKQEINKKMATERIPQDHGLGHIWDRIKHLRGIKQSEDQKAASVALPIEGVSEAQGSAKRYTRRAIVAGGIAAGAGVAAYVALGKGASPEVQEVIEPTKFDLLKQKINGSALDTNIKDESLGYLSRFENADLVINRFIDADTQEDGQSSIVSLSRKRYGALDVSPISPLNPDLESYIKSKIFFYRDRAAIDNLLGNLFKEGITVSDIAARLKSAADPKVPFNPKVDLYLNVGKNKSSERTMSLPPATLPDVVSAVNDANRKMPSIGSVDIMIVSSLPEGESIGGSTRVEKGKTVISLSLNALGNGPSRYEYVTAHEKAHALKFDTNEEVLLDNLTPEEFVNLAVAELKVIVDESVGRKFTKPEGIFRKGRKYYEQVEYQGIPTQQEFLDIASSRSDLFWFSQFKKYQGGYLSDPVFAEDVLPSNLLRNYIQEYKLDGEDRVGVSVAISQKDQEWLSKHTFKTWSAFLDSERGKVDQLAASSPVWKHVIDTLRTQTTRFEDFHWMPLTQPTRSSPLPVPERLPSGWFDALQMVGNVILAQEFLENNSAVVGLFDRGQKERITAKLIKLIDYCDNEFFADAMALTERVDAKNFGGQSNPSAEVIDLVNKINFQARSDNP